MTQSWANSFVLRDCDEIIHTKSFPQEEQRLQVPQGFPQKTGQNLKEYVQGCPTELVFNFDAVGISDWEDRETRNIVVPPRICA
jgi:hypothetical protein